jgi:hypothetical protein
MKHLTKAEVREAIAAIDSELAQLENSRGKRGHEAVGQQRPSDFAPALGTGPKTPSAQRTTHKGWSNSRPKGRAGCRRSRYAIKQGQGRP